MSTLSQNFNEKWRPIVTPIAQKYGINPDYALTQIAQESWWGTATPKNSHNYAGIRDFRRSSDGVMANDAGNVRKFRKFDNEAAFAEHYLDMLSRLYPGTVGAKSIDEFTSALQDGKRRYAESNQYKQHLAEIYNKHYGSTDMNTTVSSPQVVKDVTVGNGIVNFNPSSQGGYGVSMTTKEPAGSDPYEKLWGVKMPSTKDTEIKAKLNAGLSSPYKAGSYKFNWGFR